MKIFPVLLYTCMLSTIFGQVIVSQNTGNEFTCCLKSSNAASIESLDVKISSLIIRLEEYESELVNHSHNGYSDQSNANTKKQIRKLWKEVENLNHRIIQQEIFDSSYVVKRLDSCRCKCQSIDVDSHNDNGNDTWERIFLFLGIVISITAILISIILSMIGGDYWLSLRRMKKKLKKLGTELTDYQNDYKRSKDLHVSVQDSTYNKLIQIDALLKMIESSKDFNEFRSRINKETEDMQKVSTTFASSYKEMYIEAISSSESPAVLKRALLAIENMHLVEAESAIDILIGANIAPDHIIQLAKRVKESISGT